MDRQLHIDFEAVVHVVENNGASQKNLDKNRGYFNKQCTLVYNLLMGGMELTVYKALVDYSVSGLPRRILDLAEMGVAISKKHEGRIVIYYMSELNRIQNNEKFKN